METKECESCKKELPKHYFNLETDPYCKLCIIRDKTLSNVPKASRKPVVSPVKNEGVYQSVDTPKPRQNVTCLCKECGKRKHVKEFHSPRSRVCNDCKSSVAYKLKRGRKVDEFVPENDFRIYRLGDSLWISAVSEERDHVIFERACLQKPTQLVSGMVGVYLLPILQRELVRFHIREGWYIGNTESWNVITDIIRNKLSDRLSDIKINPLVRHFFG
jgi:hypothetical protein